VGKAEQESVDGQELEMELGQSSEVLLVPVVVAVDGQELEKELGQSPEVLLVPVVEDEQELVKEMN
jgi:hypothetical protein